MTFPAIQSAFPKRRYQFGEFSVTLLTDIETHDAVSYLYIAAVLREGSHSPEVYITCESTILDDENTCRVRVLTDNSEHIISHDPQWRQLQNFCDYALQGIRQMFELSDESTILIS